MTQIAIRKMVNIQEINISDDKKISIALMASFVVLTIQYFILIYFDLLGATDASRIQLISKALVGVIFLYTLPVVWKRSKIKFIGSYFIGFFLFLLHYWIFPENSKYIRELIFPFFFMCLPAFVYSVSLSDWKVLKQIMKKASYIVFIFGAFLGFLIFAGKASIGTYSMSLSYYMLLPTIMFLDELFDKFSLRLLLFTIISLLVILALGSRGAILCTIVFIFLKLIRTGARLSYQRIFVYSGVFGLGLLGFIFIDRILEALYNFFLNFGIKSRSISLFLREDISLSGRDYLYENLWAKILDQPIFGLGIAGDRLVLDGAYAHNLFIEVLGNFGIIIGGILVFTLLIVLVKSLFTRNIYKYNIIIIWLSIGFVYLTVSGSYLTDMKFWIFLGILANMITSKAKLKEQNKYSSY